MYCQVSEAKREVKAEYETRPLRTKFARKTKKNSLNFIRLLRVVITTSVTSLLRGENDSKQSDEFQARKRKEKKNTEPVLQAGDP